MVRRFLAIAAWVLGVSLGVPLLLVLLVFILLNTRFGQSEVERLAGQLTSGQVVIAGLSGRFPDALRLAHAEVRDAQGPWLALDGVALDWSPTRLLARETHVDLLSADKVQVLRLPVAAPTQPTPPDDNTPFNLPIRVSVAVLRVARAEIAAPVAGVAAVLALNGSVHLASLQDGGADVTIDRLDAPGSYEVHGRIDPAHIDAHVRLNEPPGGLAATAAKLPDLGTVTMQADVEGPRTAESAALQLSAGPLAATAKGTLDLVAGAADLDVSANAPAMTPAAGISWQAVALEAHVHGPFTQPDAAGSLRVTRFMAAGAEFASLTAQLQGNGGAAGLHASIDGLRIPGPLPDLLSTTPLMLQANVRLDDPQRPVTFSLTHKLVQVQGAAATAGAIAGRADLTLPDLAPLAAIGGVTVAGHAQLAVKAALASGVTHIDLDGAVAVTGGQAPIPPLLGDAAKIGLSVDLAGGDVTVSRAQVEGRTLTATATGTDKTDVLDLAYTLGLSNLTALAPTVTGTVTLQGTAKGPIGNLAVDAAAQGDVGAPGVPRGSITLTVHATGLPSQPAGNAVAQGRLEGALLDLALHADRETDGALHAVIDRADWKSLHAEGAATLPPGAKLPQGRVSLRMARLDDFRPFLGQPISGGVTAEAALDAASATLTLEAARAGIPGTEVGRLRLQARVTDLLERPSADGTLDLEGIAAAGITGSAKLAVHGPQDALALRASAALQGVAGADATLSGAATLNVPAKTVLLASLQAAWKGEDVRLLAPARITFGSGMAVNRLRLGLQQAVLEVAGRATPALNLVASLRGVTPDLAKPFVPGLDAVGQIGADAKLAGTLGAPTGTVRLAATGMRLRSGAGRTLPPADLAASVQLAGQAAAVDARLTAGQANLAMTGRAPLGAGALNLHATGAIDLAMLDPLLAANGRQVRGRVTLDAAIAGTAAAPLVDGSAVLAGGEVQDFTQGVHLTDLAAVFQATGQTVRIASLTGRAGAGTIEAHGSVGLQAPMPVDVAVTLRGARALASDRLTADLDAALAVRGDLAGTLAASGTIAIQRASINIPEHLPASVAVLNVRQAGQKPPPPAAPGVTIRLDLALSTPGQVFVRGRGLDAVLGGILHAGGTTVAPQLTGGFTLQRGTFSLAGTTLTFSRGKVSFDGAGTTDKIDPSLDFEADSVTSNVTAMLLVGGYASAPKITLSSSPALPQDEVLAQLLFGRSAKDLGPFQYAAIAAALADLSGTASVGNPLDRVRKGLGLDRLSVGSGAPGASGSSSSTAATVEAGRYVANGVYVGAKQDTTGAGTQATVEIDIAKGLKAQTAVGTGAGGNSVGLSYQFDY